MKDATEVPPPAPGAVGGRAERASGQAGLPPDDVSRRKFMQVMGASLALASASSCRWDNEEILPFARRPEGRVPGTMRRFATALETNGVAAALLVTSYDGRPIKIEGNPLHPLDAGAASARAQAAVLDLYDPDHSGGLAQTHERVTYPRTWKEFDPWFAGILAAHGTTGGAGLRVLAEPSSSLALTAMRARFQAAFPKARWFEWTPITRANELAGAKQAFGRAVRVQPKLDLVRTLVCLDADLLGEHPAALANARAFARRRAPEQGEPLRAWVIESTPSLTGAAADHRLALRAEQVLPFLLALERKLLAGAGIDVVRSPGHTAPKGGFLDRPEVVWWLERLADELAQHRGASLLAVGPRQPAAVHDLAHRMNAALGNTGRTLVHTAEPETERVESAGELKELVREMEAATVACLLMLGGNPVHDAPADVDFRGALRRVPLSLHLSYTRDETSRASTWHLPRAHALEAWGDACSWDGTRCTVQPLIDPIFERRTPLELTAQLAGVKQGARELVRAAVAPDATDAQWKKILHDGFVAGTAFPADAPALVDFSAPRVAPRALAPDAANGELELVLAADSKVFDGRGANNAWLQELPDPITKATWGNAACLAPETARALGVEDATIVILRLGERVLEAAAVVVRGQAPGSVTLRLGYGRTAAGRVGGLEEEGVESIGFDAYRLRATNALDVAHGLRIEPTGRAHALARTNDPQVTDSIGAHEQEHRVKELLRETTAARFREKPEIENAAKHRKPIDSLWERNAEGAVRWGMAIDLNACIGCNACTIACQAENNVPVVGREQVARGREMHWIRIDRYVTGTESAPKYRFQPLTCQHCDSAPCEQVCPVGATMHSAEGLNDMVYNRCIGTRYCANNCPFKVRRFNYFNYHKEIEKDGAEVQRMLHNPEVTIRHRGVMEKCTFCVQRIQAAKIPAKNAGGKVRDGAIVPACAQTCPTEAIVFGDLADAQSRVAKLHACGRAYTMLDELNLGSRTAYLAKITNPHPAADGHDG